MRRTIWEKIVQKDTYSVGINSIIDESLQQQNNTDYEY